VFGANPLRVVKLIQKRLHQKRDGVSVDSDVNVAIAANLDDRRSATAPPMTERPGRTTDTRKGGTND
jgi:hypothetical protein